MCSDTIVDETKKSRDHSPHSHAKHACVPFVDWRDCTLKEKNMEATIAKFATNKDKLCNTERKKIFTIFSPPVVITSKRKMFTKIRGGYRVSAR
jgi:hypothetical protein